MRTRTPPRSREQYILDSIPITWKSGKWLEENFPNGGEGVSDRGDGGQDSTSSRYITVIGGQKYDELAYEGYLLNCAQTHMIVGDGRGAEKDGASFWAEDLNGDLTKVEVNPDLYGKNARKVNVEQVLCFAPDSTLILVGDGTRVKQARAWLDRTKSKREVIELP